MFVQTEVTPNPNSLKFLPGKKVSNSGPYEISNKNGIENISKYETELVEYLSANNQNMIDSITSSGKLDDSNEKELQSALDSFTKTFNS